jgi:hypothetical protein
MEENSRESPDNKGQAGQQAADSPDHGEHRSTNGGQKPRSHKVAIDDPTASSGPADPSESIGHADETMSIETSRISGRHGPIASRPVFVPIETQRSQRSEGKRGDQHQGDGQNQQGPKKFDGGQNQQGGTNHGGKNQVRAAGTETARTT